MGIRPMVDWKYGLGLLVDWEYGGLGLLLIGNMVDGEYGMIRPMVDWDYDGLGLW